MTESDLVSNAPQPDLWSQFTHDPRAPRAAELRASDSDRDVVVQVLADAFADGRLDCDEFDARSGSAAGAKMLGDLPPLVEDLVPTDDTARTVATSGELQEQATQAWRRDLRNAVGTWAGPSALTTGIWGATAVAGGDAYFFWPIFVIIGCAPPLVRNLFSRSDIIEHKRRRLERQQHKEIERRRREQRGD